MVDKLYINEKNYLNIDVKKKNKQLEETRRI